MTQRRFSSDECSLAPQGSQLPSTAKKMRAFVSRYRDELIERCRAKVMQRPQRAATPEQLDSGIPVFVDQLARTLEAQDEGNIQKIRNIPPTSAGAVADMTEICVGAAQHGGELLRLGYSVNQVVHDYGDLCQAITDLAVETKEPFSVEEFRTLNRCLDHSIADAVTEFGIWRDDGDALRRIADENERIGMLLHELRNSLHTATLAFAALESGTVPISGSTGAVLKRSLSSLATLLNEGPAEPTPANGTSNAEVFSLALWIAEAANAARLHAGAKGCKFSVTDVDAEIAISGNRERLLAALNNLLRNAFKFTHPRTEVTLCACPRGDLVVVVIEVADHCGGLPEGAAASMFKPFVQLGDDRSGLGLGLTISRRNVEADGGTLSVRDLPGTGCVFTIELPRRQLL